MFCYYNLIVTIIFYYRVSDLENSLAGLPTFHRTFLLELRKVQVVFVHSDVDVILIIVYFES